MEKKNKIVISIFAALCAISTIVGYSLIKKDNNKYNQLAVMTQQDNGSYIKSNMSAFGNDDYEFDHAVCNNGTTVTANPNGGVNLTLLGTDKCTVYLKKKIKITDLEAFKASANSSASSMYSTVEPTNTISSATDDNFSKKGEQIYTVDTTHQSYYITYAEAYTFNSPTSDWDYPTYTLTNPKVGKYSDIYGSLAGKYIVNYEGHNSPTAAYSGEIATGSYGLDKIYKVVSATANSITYIPSSYTMEFPNNGTTGVYTAEDDYGTSYYFRGNVTNNYVKFGKWTEEVYRGYNSDQTRYQEYFTKEECQTSQDEAANGRIFNNGCNKSPVAGKDMYWRIVRINGDGSLRLMYDGTEAHANGEESFDRLALHSQAFNTSDNNNAYIGYMYGDPAGTTYEEVHANTNPSAIKIALETWYEKNFVGTTYESKVGDMSFCNDRSIFDHPNKGKGTGVGKARTYYGAFGRLVTTKNPSLICPKKDNDLFTSNKATQGGNGKLKYPVGLLTADEIALAGGTIGSNNRGYYVSKGNIYWLGSPSYYDNAREFYVGDNGNMSWNYVYGTLGVIPVINIPKEYAETMTGNGTMDNPYVVTDKLPDGYYLVSFDTVDMSSDYIVPKIVKEGEPYGILPVIKEFSFSYPGYIFDGWNTKPYGNGEKITSSTIVTSSANNQILYPEVHKEEEHQKQ